MKSIKHARIAIAGGEVVTLDTCEIFPGQYETMLVLEDGDELDSAVATTEAEALKDFARLRQKYEAPFLSGRYAVLAEALKAAAEAGRKAGAALGHDGGTCNFDAPALSLPRWNRKLVETAANAAGVGCFRWDLTGSYVFPLRLGYQGAANTEAAEAAREFLQSAGYNASVYYQID